jgi:hypothetical protein
MTATMSLSLLASARRLLGASPAHPTRISAPLVIVSVAKDVASAEHPMASAAAASWSSAGRAAPATITASARTSETRRLLPQRLFLVVLDVSILLSTPIFSVRCDQVADELAEFAVTLLGTRSSHGESAEDLR